MSGSSIVVDSEIGVVTKADEAAGSFTGELDVTNAEHKEKAAATGKGVVTEKDWIEFVFPIKSLCPVEIEERITAEPPTTTGAAAMITKEMVPDAVMDKLQKRLPYRKLPPIDFTDPGSEVYNMFPKMRDGYLANMARWNYLVDLHVDCLRQHTEKGFAEVGVDFTDGVKKIFILPQPEPDHQTQPQAMKMMQQQGKWQWREE